jgi:tetratricopeptide (TPR) repeat protein
MNLDQLASTRASGRAVEPGLSVGERLSLAAELLRHGDRDKARGELAAALRTNPSNARAARLLADMDADPRATLGAESFTYTVRSGDSIERLASRFLGDPLRFYILGRYNGLASLDLAPGQALMIPGERREAPKPALSVNPPPRQAPPAPKPATDPGQARALRAKALERMDRGGIVEAVALLEQAQSLDPNNPLIKNDLARARRIQTNVEAR